MLQLLYLQPLLQLMAAAAQAACSTLLDLTVGSPLLAVMEAYSASALWLQWLLLAVLARTRAATSNGADLDSFVADFFLTRLAAAPSSGTVTLTRFTSTSSAFIPPGATVKTGDFTVTFTVTIDPTNAAWSAAQGGYVIQAGVASINVPVQATIAGTVGNVQAGAISLPASSIPIDTVINGVAFTNGLNAESDAALRSRFQLYIASLASATKAAILFAATSVQQNVSAVIVEGSPGAGTFTVYVDDGSGTPPASLVLAISAAVQAARALGITAIVLPPTVNNASINVVLAVASETTRPAAVVNVSTAIAAFVDAIPTGSPLPYLRLAQIIYDADPNVTGITTLTVNGAALDIAGAVGVVIKASPLAVA